MSSNIDYLSEFAYDVKLRELGIFSRQYFNSILYNMYKDVPEDDLLCFTFGDFNKLNKINKEYSYKAGDEALKTALKLIKTNLPNDTIIARIAGDEFCFLNPNMSKKDMEKAFKNVDTVLNESKENKYGLTITTSSIDSTIFPNFDDMYAHTELGVTRKKKSNHEKEQSLSEAIYRGLSNYFSYYRIESNSLPKEYYTVLKNSIIDIVVHNLEKTNEELFPYLEKLKRTSLESNFENKHLDTNSKLATQIHNCIVNKEDLSIEGNEGFTKLLKFLVTDPLTGQVSKRFFDEAILPSFVQNDNGLISVRLFDLAHLKLSNDVIGHNTTDERITELYKNLISKLASQNTSSKYFASAGNCGLLMIEHAESVIPENKVNKILENALSNQTILNLTTASRTCMPTDISKTIIELQKECNHKKEEEKLTKIKRKETILPLQLALKDSFDLYKKTTNDPYSMENKQKLATKIFETLTQVIAEQFPEEKSNIFQDER